MRLGLIDQHVRLRPRPIDAQERHEGFLARRRILAQRLARQRRVALYIQQIVGNLERQSDVARIAMQAGARIDRDAGHDRGGIDAKGDQRPGL